jgi:hypothetical protein
MIHPSEVAEDTKIAIFFLILYVGWFVCLGIGSLIIKVLKR